MERAAQKMAKISGGVKIQDFGLSSSAKKVPLTAEIVEISPKLTKIQYGAKPDIFKYAEKRWQVSKQTSPHSRN